MITNKLLISSHNTSYTFTIRGIAIQAKNLVFSVINSQLFLGETSLTAAIFRTFFCKAFKSIQKNIISSQK